MGFSCYLPRRAVGTVSPETLQIPSKKPRLGTKQFGIRRTCGIAPPSVKRRHLTLFIWLFFFFFNVYTLREESSNGLLFGRLPLPHVFSCTNGKAICSLLCDSWYVLQFGFHCSCILYCIPKNLGLSCELWNIKVYSRIKILHAWLFFLSLVYVFFWTHNLVFS